MRKLVLFCMIFVGSLAMKAQTTVGAQEFKTLIEKKDGIILDTRSKEEFARGHIAGAVLIDLLDPKSQKTLLSFPKDKPLYCYCYSGGRSRSVAAYLVQNGYTKVFNLQRGVMEWTNSGFALVTTDAAPAAAPIDAVSIADYQKITAEKGLVFVDFYAPWCVPCKKMLPIMEELKTEYKGRVKMLKVNSDASKELTKKLGIQSVPHLVLYKNGKVVYTKDEEATKSELQKVFTSNLK